MSLSVEQADTLADISSEAWNVKQKLEQFLKKHKTPATEALQEVHNEVHGAALHLDEVFAEHVES